MSFNDKILNVVDGLLPTVGTFGVEIEAEGANLPVGLGRSNWRREQDGSLQAGLESAEYVMKTPNNLEGTLRDLDELNKLYIANGAVVEETQTSGVHVHVNVQNFTLKDLYKLSTLYFTFDELITTYCGPAREGNHFCLRGVDAENVVFALLDSVTQDDLTYLKTDNIRYCTMNFASLFKYGSIEYRAMRGTSDIHLIKSWVEILNNLVNSINEFNSPEDIVTTMSLDGVDNFIRKILKEKADLFLKVEDREKMIRDGMRLIQPLAYAVDWNKVEKASANPFRKAKKRMEELRPLHLNLDVEEAQQRLRRIREPILNPRWDNEPVQDIDDDGQ